MIRSSHGDVKIPSSTTVTRRILEYRTDVEQKIRKSLPPEPTRIAIAMDCWSAPRREGYLAIKAYWITQDWRLSEALIGFEHIPGHHTGEALARIVLERLHHFGITNRISAMTSDNASNNKTLNEALNESIKIVTARLGLQKVVSQVAQIPCLAHVIQLAVNQLTKKIRIDAKNDEITKNWIEEDELRKLEEQMQADENTIGRV
jgi:hypothetical protein